jgi:hypothetical protein
MSPSLGPSSPRRILECLNLKTGTVLLWTLVNYLPYQLTWHTKDNFFSHTLFQCNSHSSN